MAAKMRVFFDGVVESGAFVSRFGARGTPIKEVTITGQPDASPSRITVAAGATVVLWSYTANDPSFTLFHAKLTSGSYAVVSTLVAKDSLLNAAGSAVAAGLPVATGTRAWRWRHTDLNDAGPFVLTSPYAYMNDDGATTASDTGNTLSSGYTAGDQSGIDGSLPTLWAGAATPIAGRIYKVVVHNPSATDSIEVEYGKVT